MSVAIARKRLETWKEVAAFFGKDERTVRRWERERGLPIRRLPGSARSRIYADVAELEAWLKAAPEDEPEDDIKTAIRPISIGRLLGRHPLVIGAVAAVLTAAAVAVAVFLPSRLPVAAKPLTAGHVPRPEARRQFEAGMKEWNRRTPDSLGRALNEFTAAIKLDADYADAYGALANCYDLMPEYTLMPPSEAYPLAIAAAQRALKLNPQLAAAHRAYAFAAAYGLWDTRLATRQFRAAVALNPRSSLNHHWFATFLSALGDYDESLPELDKATALDPKSEAIKADRGIILYEAGRKDEARALLTSLEAADPKFLSPHNYLARIDLLEGHDLEFLRESETAARLTGDLDRLKLIALGRRGLAARGHTGMLEALRQEQIAQFKYGKATAYSVAQLCALLGRNSEALDYLTISVDRHETELVALRADPVFSSLRDADRFTGIEHRAGPARSPA